MYSRTRAQLPLYVCHVAARLRVSPRTVRWWAITGQLPARRLGVKIWIFDEVDVIAFMECRLREKAAA